MSAGPDRIKARLVADGRGEGFDLVGVTSPDALPEAPARLAYFLDQNRHGTMAWLEERADWRTDPRRLWPEVRSIILLGMNYGPDHDPLESLSLRDRATLSVYAANRDYHDVIKGKLKQVAGRFAAANGAAVKVFVDTAPVMEKPLAEKAGLGWQGKHTNLVSREFGSWLFLGAIFTDLALPPDEPEPDHCGSCRACLDICPTDAFPAPYQLDARRCISYLTIEHKGPIDRTLRAKMGNRIYGCDDCLAVCPWNKFASTASEVKLKARADRISPSLEALATLDDSGFRALFQGSPVKRIGRAKFISNVLIAIGNSGEPSLADCARGLLQDGEPIIRAMAVWAMRQLVERPAFDALRNMLAAREQNPMVQEEWTAD
ncbi:MAG: tRNA epoxyqueuosine(34) reductase QueG [Rhizobiales bacterium]|nr:tRNA epoxyqueuosine(34) reductase QueG [Hyphomicrobiales bacterium]